MDPDMLSSIMELAVQVGSIAVIVQLLIDRGVISTDDWSAAQRQARKVVEAVLPTP